MVYGIGGIYNVQDILYQWETAGVFDFVLPFLLIFAIIFGILTATNAFGKNKGVHVIVSIAVALMSLRATFGGRYLVQEFFRDVFPQTAVALSVILVAVILTSVFIPKEHLKGWLIGFYSIGGLAALIVVFNTFSDLNWFSSMWWSDYGGMLIGLLFVVAVIVAVSISGDGKKSSSSSTEVTLKPWRED